MAARGDYQFIEPFLSPIAGSSPAGVPLNYDPVYDKIREARSADDPELPRGIWVADLKEADWQETESLCAEALLKRTKDLQIVGWLTEAWIAQDQFPGLTRGVTLFCKLAATFWDTIYPLNEEGEERSNIIEWYVKIMYARIIKIPITRASLDDTTYTYGDYLEAQYLEKIAKRQSPNNQPTVSAKSTAATMSQFTRSLNHTNDEFLEKTLSDVEEAQQALVTFVDVLSPKIPVPSIKKITDSLNDIKRVLTNEFAQRVPATAEPEPIPGSELEESTENPEAGASPDVPPQTANVGAPPIPAQSPGTLGAPSNPAQAYEQLSKIADYLERVEPQSPTHKMLRQLVTWQSKNLVDILNQIAQTPEDFAILMRLLGGKF